MATIKDVAREAGVAVGSVSKVINNIPVKDKTKKAVQDAIKKLNYEPDIYARGLKINKTNTVAVIVPTIWNPFFSELVYNIEKCLRKYDMKMILCNSEKNQENEIQYISMAKQNKMDGIIAVTYNDIDKYVTDKIPFVSIDRYFSDDVVYVSSDNYNGGRMAAERLKELGCKNIAYIGRGSKIDNATRKRKEGFVSFCIENNMNYYLCDVVGGSDEYEKLLDIFINEKIIKDKAIDGIFAVTDEYAIDFINKIKKYDIDIPEDIQVIGFDGIRSSKADNIKISTIRQPIELIAEESVEALNKILEKKKLQKEIILPVKYIRGNTTK